MFIIAIYYFLVLINYFFHPTNKNAIRNNLHLSLHNLYYINYIHNIFDALLEKSCLFSSILWFNSQDCQMKKTQLYYFAYWPTPNERKYFEIRHLCI